MANLGHLCPAWPHLLQSANSGPQLGEASSVSKGPVVAAYGLLTVMLRLVQLSKLFPEPWLGWLPQQGLDTAMQGLQLPVEGSRGRCPTEWALGVIRLKGTFQGLSLTSNPRTFESPTYPGA